MVFGTAKLEDVCTLEKAGMLRTDCVNIGLTVKTLVCGYGWTASLNQ